MTAPHSVPREARARRTAACIESLATADDKAERTRLIDEVVTVNMGVADAVVSRYRSRGVPVEDLRQVAYLALVKAAQNFDPGSGNDFLSYAVPTMRGEVRRYFRDLGWFVRPPRRVQELQHRVSVGSSELRATLGREPTLDEVAERIGEPPLDVREALRGAGAFSPASLDSPAGDPEHSATLGDLLTDEDGTDPATAVEARVVLGPVVSRLDDRDRRILRLRYFEGMTQQQIGEDIGVTQMQVSRLLSRIFRDLREQLDADDVPALLA